MRHDVDIPLHGIHLAGTLELTPEANGVVLFVHGNGSNRFSRRNEVVAAELRKHHMATLLFDLFTPVEQALDEPSLKHRFDVGATAGRVSAVTEWLRDNPLTAQMDIAYYGSSTGAAAALVAAAQHPDVISSVVCRGGRADLAVTALPRIRAATLLIAGANDGPMLEVNRWAYRYLMCEKRFEVVPGAGHLFEEPGALDEVAALSAGWFVSHFRGVLAI